MEKPLNIDLDTTRLIGSLEAEIFSLRHPKNNNIDLSHCDEGNGSFLENESLAYKDADSSNSSIESFKKMEEISELNAYITELSELLNESRKENIRISKMLEDNSKESVPVDEFNEIYIKYQESFQEIHTLKTTQEKYQKESQEKDFLIQQLQTEIFQLQNNNSPSIVEDNALISENGQLRRLLRSNEFQLTDIQRENKKLKEEIENQKAEFSNTISSLTSSMLVSAQSHNINQDDSIYIKEQEKIVQIQIENTSLKRIIEKLNMSLQAEIESHCRLNEMIEKYQNDYAKYAIQCESRFVEQETILRGIKTILKIDDESVILPCVQRLTVMSNESSRLRKALIDTQLHLTEEIILKNQLKAELDSKESIDNVKTNHIIMNTGICDQLTDAQSRISELLNEIEELKNSKSHSVLSEGSSSDLLEVLTTQNNELRSDNEELLSQIEQLKDQVSVLSLTKDSEKTPQFVETIEIIVEQLEKSEKQTRLSIDMISLFNALKQPDNIDGIIDSLEALLHSRDEAYDAQKIISNQINLNVDQFEREQKLLEEIDTKLQPLYSKLMGLNKLSQTKHPKKVISKPQVSRIALPSKAIHRKPLDEIPTRNSVSPKRSPIFIKKPNPRAQNE